VYQHYGVRQTALVLLNKSDEPREIAVSRWVSSGTWRDAFTGTTIKVPNDDLSLVASVPAHGVKVLFLDAPVNNVDLMRELDRLQAAAERRR
jgi:cyclomaltodextrin glucanotransferase